MYFGLSEDQLFFQDNVSRFLADHASLDVIKKITEGEGKNLQKEIDSGLLNLGIHSLLVPEEYGGLDLDLLFAAAVSQSLGENVAPFSFLGPYVMAPIALSHGASDEQKRKYLTGITENKIKFAIGFAEFISARNGSGCTFKNNKVNGRLMFVLDMEGATHLLLADESGCIGIVDLTEKDIEIIELTTVDKTRSYSEVILNDVSIDLLEKSLKDNLLLIKQ